MQSPGLWVVTKVTVTPTLDAETLRHATFVDGRERELSLGGRNELQCATAVPGVATECVVSFEVATDAAAGSHLRLARSAQDVRGDDMADVDLGITAAEARTWAARTTGSTVPRRPTSTPPPGHGRPRREDLPAHPADGARRPAPAPRPRRGGERAADGRPLVALRDERRDLGRGRRHRAVRDLGRGAERPGAAARRRPARLDRALRHGDALGRRGGAGPAGLRRVAGPRPRHRRPGRRAVHLPGPAARHRGS